MSGVQVCEKMLNFAIANEKRDVHAIAVSEDKFDTKKGNKTFHQFHLLLE
jgi:hypothetical protein